MKETKDMIVPKIMRWSFVCGVVAAGSLDYAVDSGNTWAVVITAVVVTMFVARHELVIKWLGEKDDADIQG